MFIKEIRFPNKNNDLGYPFNLDILNNKTLSIDNPVTIFIGSNGSGKTTIIESLAASINSINISSGSISDDEFMREIVDYSKKIKISYKYKTKSGFFFRAVDFITFRHGLTHMKNKLLTELAEIDEEFKNKSDYARQLARGPFLKSIYEIENTYSNDLNKLSHGESFLEFFSSRFTKKGIYILDEPETPLSPENQYTLLVMIKNMVEKGSQFIISTHSPIIMAYKNAKIFDLDNKFNQTDYEDIDSIKFLRDFLLNKERYMHYLERDDEE
ncbi:AAA family ATPase [Mycoplasmatota bacterium WC44]